MIEFLTKYLPLWLRPRQILEMRQRAGAWRRVRAEHLAKYPACAACGRTKNVVPHHVIPVSVDASRELDPENLITLCDDPCHIVFGHFLSYQCYNSEVRTMAAAYKQAHATRKCLKDM